MKIKLTLSYDGTNYAGYQVQDNALTVQEVLENALEKLTGEKISTVASGRTDAGVHALGQVVSFETNSTIPPEKFYKALNVYLPDDVKALSSRQVDDSFNARKSAKTKTYTYSLYVSETPNPLKERYSSRIPKSVDFSLVKQGALVLEGEHDFKCMCSTGSSVNTTIRTVYSVEVLKTKGDVKIVVKGNGFLYNMVRIMVGTLIQIGLKEKTIDDLKKALNTGDRTLVGKTFPAKGLCLTEVQY